MQKNTHYSAYVLHTLFKAQMNGPGPVTVATVFPNEMKTAQKKWKIYFDLTSKKNLFQSSFSKNEKFYFSDLFDSFEIKLKWNFFTILLLGCLTMLTIMEKLEKGNFWKTVSYT